MIRRTILQKQSGRREPAPRYLSTSKLKILLPMCSATSLALAILLGSVLAAPPPDLGKLTRFEASGIEMAVPIKIVMYAPNQATADRAAEAAMARIHQLNGVMSDYDPQSEVRKLAATSGRNERVPLGDDLWHVLNAAVDLSERSEGAFDVTVGPVVRLWRRARRNHQMPSPERVAQALQAVGYQSIQLDPITRSAKLLKPDTRIDLGGIAKGYAIDEALAELRRQGISRALVDAGGDVGLGDPPPEKPGWVIAIAPLEPDAPPSRFLQLSRAAVATSGDTWQYVEIDGRRYSHLVDPRTGIGLTDHSSVTVIAADAITADGLASALSVLGPKKGMELIDATPGTAALIVRAPEGRIETTVSRSWAKLPVVSDVGQRKGAPE